MYIGVVPTYVRMIILHDSVSDMYYYAECDRYIRTYVKHRQDIVAISSSYVDEFLNLVVVRPICKIAWFR